MTTVRQYTGVYRTWMRFVGNQLGTDLGNSSIQIKAVAGAMCAILGVLTKALVDKGVVTDAEIQDAAQTAVDDPGWTQEP